MTDCINFFCQKKNLEKKEGFKWDTTAITPGTTFMKKMSIAIYNYFSNISSNIDYHVSCSDKIGEGEHKIFEFISSFYLVYRITFNQLPVRVT